MIMLDTPMLTLEPAHHQTFLDCAPFSRRIDDRVEVKIVEEALSNQNASALFFAFKVTVVQAPIVSVSEQYTPDSSTAPDRSPEARLTVHTAEVAAEKATSKSSAACAAVTVPASLDPESRTYLPVTFVPGLTPIEPL